MTTTDRRTLPTVVAVSGLAHLAVLALLAITHPTLRQADAPPVFEVQVVPLFVPSPRSEQPKPKRLVDQPIRPRRALRLQEDPSVAPLVTPFAPDRTTAPPAPAVALPAPAAPAGPATGAALRLSPVGCANPQLLSKAERDRCLERLGAGARDAPYYEPPMSRDKRKAFDEAAARKQAYRKYKEANLPNGVSPGGLEMKPLPEVWTPHN
ncbi:hypothetical protein M9M90_09065 [Phenylobacterium sp. LH3H17]|uniref:hypothetical protein n=1 Tax=Phenylobacterium sp. LH3H17 TaxID=2903901 RepID=UPI0020C94336|nr:hypothetical protein [Phenylobacterium sp. LH3H17]UTP41307.1 hypothetical protein M9M90_09065 [Phenylobacterium sp. LH3H17]